MLNLRRFVRPVDVGDHRVQQSVVTRHVPAVLGFAVELSAEAYNRLGMAGGGFFKEFEGLADAGATVADGSVVFDVDKGKGVNGACGALAGIDVSVVGLAQEKDYAGVGAVCIRAWVCGLGRRNGVGAEGSGF